MLEHAACPWVRAAATGSLGDSHAQRCALQLLHACMHTPRPSPGVTAHPHPNTAFPPSSPTRNRNRNRNTARSHLNGMSLGSFVRRLTQHPHSACTLSPAEKNTPGNDGIHTLVNSSLDSAGAGNKPCGAPPHPPPPQAYGPWSRQTGNKSWAETYAPDAKLVAEEEVNESEDRDGDGDGSVDGSVDGSDDESGDGSDDGAAEAGGEE